MSDIVERLRVKELLSIEEDGYTHFLPKNPDGDDGADEIIRLRAENETLRRDVKTAIMGDSAELADVKRENEKLREALNGVLKAFENVTMDENSKQIFALRAAAAAIRESGAKP